MSGHVSVGSLVCDRTRLRGVQHTGRNRLAEGLARCGFEEFRVRHGVVSRPREALPRWAG
jgi:hypothetical protein